MHSWDICPLEMLYEGAGGYLDKKVSARVDEKRIRQKLNDIAQNFGRFQYHVDMSSQHMDLRSDA